MDNCCSVRRTLKGCLGEDLLVLLDPFHAIKRLTDTHACKLHPLYRQLSIDLSNALFHWNDADVKLCRAYLKSRCAASVAHVEGERESVEHSAAAWKFIKRHSRRHLRDKATQRAMILHVLATYNAVEPDKKGRVLLHRSFVQAVKQLLVHVDLGCLQDPPTHIQPIYLDLGPINSHELAPHRWLCMRGTSQLEGFHAKLARLLPGDFVSAKLADAIILSYLHRWNMQRRRRYGGEADFGTSDTALLDAAAKLGLLPVCDDGKAYVPTHLLLPPKDAGEKLFYGSEAALASRTNEHRLRLSMSGGASTSADTDADPGAGAAAAMQGFDLWPVGDDSSESGDEEEDDEVTIGEEELIQSCCAEGFKGSAEGQALRAVLRVRPPVKIAPARKYRAQGVCADEQQVISVPASNAAAPPPTPPPTRKRKRMAKCCNMPKQGHPRSSLKCPYRYNTQRTHCILLPHTPSPLFSLSFFSFLSPSSPFLSRQTSHRGPLGPDGGHRYVM